MPVGFLEDVIEARRYRSAKRALDDVQSSSSKTKAEDLKRLKMSWPLVGLAHEIEMGLVQERINGR